MSAPRIAIASITTTRLDIPLCHPIRMSFGVVGRQNIVLVRIRDRDGAEGVGEASILGGPHWGEESAEGVQAVIERYIAPAIVGNHVDGIEAFAARLATLVRGNPSARAALEMAMLDLIGRRLGVSAGTLLGGRARQSVPLAWTLSTGSLDTDLAEGERAFSERGHRRFKLKLGRDTAQADVARALAIVEAFRGRATVIADVNQAWDAVTAARFLPALAQGGLEGIEQPLPAGDLTTIAHLRRGLAMDVIADEAVTGPEAMFRLAAAGAASAVSLKPNRDGGLSATRRVAAIADAAGMRLYGGSMLESSIGTAASLHVYAAMPHLALGCELFGPLRLEHDLVETPLTIRDGELILPDGPGLGVRLDEEKIAFLARSQRSVGHMVSAAAHA